MKLGVEAPVRALLAFMPLLWRSNRFRFFDGSRRGVFLCKGLILIAGGLCNAGLPSPGLERLYFGTYTSSTSVGIYQANFDLGTGVVGAVSLAGSAGNPSFLALHPSGNFLFAVNENAAQVAAFAVNRTSGALTALNQQPSGGASPCHIVVDRAGKNLLVANYTGGSVTVFPIQADGRLGAATSHIQHPGASPHAHCIALDAENRFALVCDLGLDRIFSYRFNSITGTLTSNTTPWISVTSGAGPRHLAFDPQYRRAYVICELNSTIIGFNYDSQNGVLSPFQTNSSLPAGWSGNNGAAEIAVHPSGRFLYGSNRGCNTVAVFALDGDTGRLTPIQQQSVGTTPRQFAIDPTGAFCLVADQDSNDVRVYSINSQTGQLTATGQTLKIAMAVCVLPILTQPPQPVLAMHSAANTLQMGIGHSLSSLTYQLERAPALRSGTNWSPVAVGARGQTNFILTNASAQEFFRVGVTTNY